MQHPSLHSVRIRSTRDALHVFHAVARNIIPLITRRLDAEERRAIAPGNVYVWEERSANSEATGLGMERWTDGMGWGPSRVRDDFLFYHQKECDASDDPAGASTPWAQMISMYPSPRSRATSESGRLIKQTYSVRVSLPDDRPRGIVRKWHLTAYFSQQKLDRLNTVDNIHGIGDVPIPDGWFRSARRDGKSRREDDLPRSVVAKRMPQAPIEAVIPTSDPLSPSFYISHLPTPAYTQFPTSANASQLDLPNAPPVRKPTFSLPSSAEYHHYTQNVRQTTYSEPNLISGRDHIRCWGHLPGLVSSSPPSSSSSNPPTPSPRVNLLHLSEKLVPLDHLQTLAYPRRDPIDEQILQRFSMQALASTTLNATFPGHASSRSFPDRMKS